MRLNVKNWEIRKEGLTMAMEKSATQDDYVIVGGCFLIVLAMFFIFA